MQGKLQRILAARPFDKSYTTSERHWSKNWKEDLTAYSHLAFSNVISQQMGKKGVD